ncbi:unnamed protein product [Rhodiola kirilowii]
MLHRSFKPAKCKTALRLTVSRIKLLKNKSASHVTQLRREVAQLLETGQERTARIRVEHVIREEKTMAAYDLLEVYCELIVARLPMIESQKNCPIDLKEAVTSVIFASPRCADLEELQEVRKHFQSKYGKEFTTAALELRPGCGVSRLMIEKLSAGAPDVQTKTKILSAIALEHNINWDPNTSGENAEKPPEDLLNGPNSFLRASQKYEEPPAETPTNDTQKHDSHLNQNPSSSPISHTVGYSAMPSTSQPQLGTPNARAEGMEHRYSYSEDQKTFAAGRQNWNMEFTDATSAAQAAAEAAERASMAARAAAELSSGERFARQQSSELKRSSVNDLKNESIGKHAGSTMNNVKDPANKLEHGGDPRMQTDKFSMKNSDQSHARPGAAHQNEGLETFSRQSQIPLDPVFRNDGQETYSKLDSLRSDHFGAGLKSDSRDDFRVQGTKVNEQGNQTRVNEQLNSHVHVRESSRSDSLKSSTSFPEDEMFLKGSSHEDIYFQGGQSVKHDNNSVGEAAPERRSSNYTTTEAEDINYFADEIWHEKSTSSNSQSLATKFEDDCDEQVLDKLDDADHGKFHSHSTENVVFDNSGSDDDVNYKFEITGGFKNDYSDPFRSPDRRLPIYESPKRSSLFTSDTRRESYEEFVPKPIFSDNESSLTKLSGDVSENVGSSHSHESLPVEFDQSDSEVELHETDLVESSVHETSRRHGGFSTKFINEECVTPLTTFDDDELQQHIHSSRHSFFSERESKPAEESTYTRIDEKSTEQISPDTGKELNLGMLSGGFRNKGKKHPYYNKSLSDDVPSLPSDDMPVNDNLLSAQTRSSSGIESSATQILSSPQESKRTDNRSRPRFKVTHYDPEKSSDSEDELPQISIRHNQERRSQNASSEGSHKSSFNSRSTYLDHDNLHNEEGTTEQVSRSKPDFGSSPVASHKSSFSPRPTYSDNDNLQNEEKTVSHSKPHLSTGLSRRTKTSTPDVRRKPTREIYGAASSSVMETQTSNRDEQSEEPRLTKPFSRKPGPEVKKHIDKPSSSNEQLKYSSNVSLAPSTATVSPSNPKAEKATTKQDSSKKASHVHPKLPDFDTLAAHFNSLRTNGK